MSWYRVWIGFGDGFSIRIEVMVRIEIVVDIVVGVCVVIGVVVDFHDYLDLCEL